MKQCVYCGHRNESYHSNCVACGKYIRNAPEVSDVSASTGIEGGIQPLTTTESAELRVAGNKDYKFIVSAGAVVGRGADVDVTIVPGSNYTARRHARFYKDAGEWWIEPIAPVDPQRASPTLVGGRRLRQPERIASGDTITLGSVSFVFTVKS